jgi:hypothetical protein
MLRQYYCGALVIMPGQERGTLGSGKRVFGIALDGARDEWWGWGGSNSRPRV